MKIEWSQNWINHKFNEQAYKDSNIQDEIDRMRFNLGMEYKYKNFVMRYGYYYQKVKVSLILHLELMFHIY